MTTYDTTWEWPERIEWPQMGIVLTLLPSREYGADVEVRRYGGRLPAEGRVSVMVQADLRGNTPAHIPANAELVKLVPNGGSVTLNAAYQGVGILDSVRGVLQDLDLKMKLLAMELSYRP